MSKFFKLPMPADPYGRKTPGVWLNPIFFRFVAYPSKHSSLDDLELLPSTIWASALPENQALYSLKIVDLKKSDSNADMGRIYKIDGESLHVNPSLLAAVIEHELSETKPGGIVATKLFFVGATVAKFGDLKTYTVDGATETVAETLKITLPTG